MILSQNITEEEIDAIIKEADEIIYLKEENEKQAEAHFKKGQCIHLKGKFNTAIKNYSEAIRIYPDYLDAYNSRGLTYYYKGEYGKAIDDLDEAIKLNPKYVEAYINRGLCHDHKGEYNKAIEDFEEAIKLKPSNTDAHNNRGLTYYHKGEYKNAIDDFTKIIKLDNKYSDAYNNRGIVYLDTEKYDICIKDFTNAIAKNDRHIDAYNNRGVAYVYCSEFDKAIKDFEKTKEIRADYTEDAKHNLEISQDYKFVQKQLEANPNLNPFGAKPLGKIPYFFIKISKCFLKKKKNKENYLCLIKLVYFLWEESWRKHKPRNDTAVYQYTEQKTLCKITTNQQLRLTPPGYLNDPEEGKVFYSQLGKLFEENEECNKYAKYLNDLKHDTSGYVVFIRSLTALEDNLTMWKTYGDNGNGVAVGMASSKINKGIGLAGFQISSAPLSGKNDTDLSAIISNKIDERPENTTYIPLRKIGLYKVLYSKEKKIKDKLNEIKNCLKKIIDDSVTGEDTDQIYVLFSSIAHLIKDQAYKHENEYRLMYIASVRDDKDYIRDSSPSDGSNNDIFIETEPVLFEDENKEDIIRFGPKVDDITILKYQHSLIKKDFSKKIMICKSGISYR
jgi:tetratricopeptide (TPR) repeat protein